MFKLNDKDVLFYEKNIFNLQKDCSKYIDTFNRLL